MNLSERLKIIENSKPTGEKKSLRFKEDTQLYEVKDIPLKALLYNPYNGRIGSLVKAFESSQGRKISNENPDDIKVIEQYLYDSASARNAKTIESLKEIGQQEFGIITRDGVIIDGNRRACMLNILSRQKVNTVHTFKAIVLDCHLVGNEKDITLLETRYQMGVDSKVDYNPIEKYIRCYDLNKKHSFSIKEISELMAETPEIINDWLGRFELMEDYLNYIGTPNAYIRLDKREGHFVDLKGYLKNYLERKNDSWEYNDDDVSDLKNVYFDYIRLGAPVQRVRVIGRPSKGNSFFTNQAIWLDFIQEHKNIKKVVVEKSFDELKIRFPHYDNREIIKIIDNHWSGELKDILVENLSFNEISLKEINESFVPLKTLKRVRNSLFNMNTDNIESSTIEESNYLIKEIEEKLSTIKLKINS